MLFFLLINVKTIVGILTLRRRKNPCLVEKLSIKKVYNLRAISACISALCVSGYIFIFFFFFFFFVFCLCLPPSSVESIIEEKVFPPISQILFLKSKCPFWMSYPS